MGMTARSQPSAWVEVRFNVQLVPISGRMVLRRVLRWFAWLSMIYPR